MGQGRRRRGSGRSAFRNPREREVQAAIAVATPLPQKMGQRIAPTRKQVSTLAWQNEWLGHVGCPKPRSLTEADRLIKTNYRLMRQRGWRPGR